VGESLSTDVALVADAARAYCGGGEPADTRSAVRAALRLLAAVAPGRSVEVRIPGHAAAQVIAGTTHRRGTPSAVVETDARTWILLASGDMAWASAIAEGRVQASGERSDLSPWLPLVRRD